MLWDSDSVIHSLRFDIRDTTIIHTTVLISISDKKQKHSSAANHARSAQAEMTFRQIRGMASTLPSTGLLPNGYRVLITNLEQDSRWVKP